MNNTLHDKSQSLIELAKEFYSQTKSFADYDQRFVDRYWSDKNNEKLNPNSKIFIDDPIVYLKCFDPNCDERSHLHLFFKALAAFQNGQELKCFSKELKDIANSSRVLFETHPDFVNQYWDFEAAKYTVSSFKKSTGNRINNILDPRSSIKASNKLFVALKCKNRHCRHQFRMRIDLAVAAYDRGEKICPQCRKWDLNKIIEIVASLKNHIKNLSQLELRVIFQQAGFEDLDEIPIIQQLVSSKLSSGDRENISAKLSKGLAVDDILSEYLEPFEPDSKTTDTISSKVKHEDEDLPTLSCGSILDFLDKFEHSGDRSQAINFLVRNQVAKLWNAVIGNRDKVIAEINSWSGSGLGMAVKSDFLRDYQSFSLFQVPSNWLFESLNDMQKLLSIMVTNNKRFLNLSLTGTGKTIGSILAVESIGAKLIIVVCENSTLDGWQAQIKACVSRAVVYIKPSKSQIEDAGNSSCWDINVSEEEFSRENSIYLVFNHESFQQQKSSQLVKWLVDWKIDAIILDEIHRYKQRGMFESKRRKNIHDLIIESEKTNQDLRVIGSTATPVINSVQECYSLLELVTSSYLNKNSKPTISNCINLHQQLVINSIRIKSKPSVKVNRSTMSVEINDDILEQLRENGLSILGVERILTLARIPAILENIAPKTIVYTHFVDQIVESLIESIGGKYSVGVFIGEDKSGLEGFVNGSTDVLIASKAIAIGTDGLQNICSNLVINIPPWSSSELEQLEGRIYRTGQNADINVVMIATYGYDGDRRWSWDEDRIRRIENKKILANAIVDGKIDNLSEFYEDVSIEQAFDSLSKWLSKIT